MVMFILDIGDKGQRMDGVKKEFCSAGEIHEGIYVHDKVRSRFFLTVFLEKKS